MSILQPREDRFYRLFEEASANVRRGAELLLLMLQNYSDVPAKAKAIKAVEHAGDQFIHDTYDQLNKIFVTPLDREDIGATASALDDIIDLIEAAADDFVLYDIQEPLPPAIELARLLVLAATAVQEAVGCLSQLSRKRVSLRESLEAINHLEHDGDEVYRSAIQDIFTRPDPILIIKWKQIYDHLERAMDKCEDFADVLHGVLLKYG